MTTCGVPCHPASSPLNLTEIILRQDLATRFIAGRPGRRPRDTVLRSKQWAPICTGYRCFFLGRLHRARIPNLLQAINYSGHSAEVGNLNAGGAWSQRLLGVWTSGASHLMVDDYACAQRGGNNISANSSTLISSSSNRTSRRAARAAKLHRSVLGDQRCAAPRASVRFDRLYNETADKLKTSFGQRARLSRTSSLNASLRVANDSLAFLHLDARDGPAATSGRSPFVNADVPLVGFSSMLDDITAWWPKVCAGGLLVGHDWTLAVPLNQRGQLRRGRWTPKHPVAYAVRRFLRTLEAKAVAEEEEEDEEEGEEEAPEGFWRPNKTRTSSNKNNSVKAGDLEAYKKALLQAQQQKVREAFLNGITQRGLGIFVTADHPASFIMMKKPEPGCAVVV